jgi:hypothetical protein
MRSRVFSALFALVVLFPTTNVAASETGIASHYSPGLMERVARVRHMQQPRGTCMIARLTHADLGHWFTVQSRISGRTRTCLAVDYAHIRDRATIARKGIVAELRYEDALYLCGTVRERPEQCKIRIWRS